MPVRNCSRWVEDALRSVADQTLPPREILVADDASTDGTADLVESLGMPGVRLLRTEERRGISFQLNRMVEAAGGRYLARMDGDDISHPDRFRRQMELLDRRSLGVVGTWVRRFGTSGTKHRFSVEDPDLKADLLFSTPFCHPSVVIDREKVRSLRYEPRFDMAEDYRLWYRLRAETTYGNVPDFLLDWRMHDANVGTSPETAPIQRNLASGIRDDLLREYGVALSSEQRAALEARTQAVTLDLPATHHFLEALVRLGSVPEDRLLAPRAAFLRRMAAQWDLSCLLSAWNTPGIPALWYRGCRKLSVPATARTGFKILLKRSVRTRGSRD